MNEDGRMNELSKKEKARLDREMKHLHPESRRHREHGAASRRDVRDRLERGRDCREGSAPHGRAGGFRGGHELRSRRRRLDHSGERRRVARDSFVHLEDFRIGARRPHRLSGSRRSRTRSRRKIRRLWTASSTSTPARTSNTRSRKATSSKAEIPPGSARRGRRSNRSSGRGISLIAQHMPCGERGQQLRQARRFRYRQAPGLFAAGRINRKKF